MKGLKPIETCPKDGTYFIAWGKSGYSTTPLRCHVCRWDPKYRPSNPLVTSSDDSFTDDGEGALYWSPLPFDPSKMLNTTKINELKAQIAEREKMILELGGDLDL